MPINAIILQPNTNDIQAAYRPVVLRVSANKTGGGVVPPVVYCDIYFNGVFYKTLSKTIYTKKNVGDSEWEFDIQDACQEYLKKFIGPNGGGEILEVPIIVARTSCKFRSSGLDSDGFITTEGTAPVQGSEGVDPVAGTGTTSNEFYVVNATLQHEDNQNLSLHLKSFKKRTWAEKTYPLTHRPEVYKVRTTDSDYFPILHDGKAIASLALNYKLRGQSTIRTTETEGFQTCPIVTGISYVIVSNGDNTFTITFSFNPLSAPAAQLNIQYRKTGSSNVWTDSIGTITGDRELTLPNDVYDFRFVVTGDCIAQASPVISNIGYIPCVPVAPKHSLALPDAIVGQAYNVVIEFKGTEPFTLSDFSGPAGLSATLDGKFVRITGTPTTAATGANITFKISNCAPSGSGEPDEFEFDDEIDVISNSLVAEVQIMADVDFSSVVVDNVLLNISPYSYPISSGSARTGLYSGTSASKVEVMAAGSPGIDTILRLIDSNGISHTKPWMGNGLYTFWPVDISNGFQLKFNT